GVERTSFAVLNVFASIASEPFSYTAFLSLFIRYCSHSSGPKVFSALVTDDVVNIKSKVKSNNPYFLIVISPNILVIGFILMEVFFFIYSLFILLFFFFSIYIILVL